MTAPNREAVEAAARKLAIAILTDCAVRYMEGPQENVDRAIDLGTRTVLAALPFLAPQPSRSDEEAVDWTVNNFDRLADQKGYLLAFAAAVRAEATLAANAAKDVQIAALKKAQWLPIDTAPKGVKVIGGYWNSLGKWRSIMARYYPPGTLETSADYDFVDHDGYAPEGWYEESETHEEIMRCETLTHWQPCPYRAALEMSGGVL